MSDVDSGNLFRSYIENVNDIIYVLNPEGVFTYISPGWTDFMGEPAENAVGRSFEFYVHPDNVKMYRSALNVLIQTGVKQSGMEYRVRHNDGSWRWHESSGAPVTGSDGSIMGYIAVARDMTEQMKLKKEEQHLRRVLESIRNINQLILAEKNKDELIAGSCQTLTETLGYFNTWIALLDENKSVYATASKGFGNEGFSSFDKKLRSGNFPWCMEEAINGNGFFVVEDPFTQCQGCDLSRDYSGRAGICGAMVYDGRLYGVLGVSVPGEYARLNEEHELFREMVRDVAFALHKIDIEGERERTERLIEENRRLYREQIRESEKKYRTVFETTPDAVMINTFEGVIIDVNQAFAFLTGYSGNEVIGKYTKDLKIWVIPEDREKMYEKIKRDGFVDNVESQFRCRDGTISTGLLSARLIELNKEPYLLSITRDITERKKAEHALEESEQKFRSIFENGHVCMLIVNQENGQIVDANPAAEKFYGWSREELIGKNISEINVLTEEEVLAEMQAARSAERNHFYFRHRLQDASLRDVEVYSGTIRIQNRELLYSLVYDITDRKKAEEQVQKLLADKELILKEVHHRIKNNMNTMMSLLSLQAGAQEDERLASILMDARSRMQGMMVLYEKLYLSKDVREMSVKEYLPALVDRIAALFSGTIKVKIVKDIDDFILGVSVLSPLGIIINELITNAMKYAFTDGENNVLTVTVRKTGEHIVITIRDNGVGLPEGRSPSPDTESGFGLQLVSLLTEQLDGSMEYKNENGSVFTLEFDSA